MHWSRNNNPVKGDRSFFSSVCPCVGRKVNGLISSPQNILPISQNWQLSIWCNLISPLERWKCGGSQWDLCLMIRDWTNCHEYQNSRDSWIFIRWFLVHASCASVCLVCWNSRDDNVYTDLDMNKLSDAPCYVLSYPHGLMRNRFETFFRSIRPPTQFRANWIDIWSRKPCQNGLAQPSLVIRSVEIDKGWEIIKAFICGWTWRIDESDTKTSSTTIHKPIPQHQEKHAPLLHRSKSRDIIFLVFPEIRRTRAGPVHG
jgi:hypothetical protein